ncbi:MAG: SDR family oxidoreductase, partial [Chloroflexota bacterium]|nr:SDR family oxidoreductase [Chloroflexota bacterium]
MGGWLEGKIIVVTGGARGIGEAIVRRAVADGARAVVADPGDPESPLERTRYVHCDVSDRASVEAFFASIADDEGGVDILVNNAGIQRVGLTETFDPMAWEQVIQT